MARATDDAVSKAVVRYRSLPRVVNPALFLFLELLKPGCRGWYGCCLSKIALEVLNREAGWPEWSCRRLTAKPWLKPPAVTPAGYWRSCRFSVQTQSVNLLLQVGGTSSRVGIRALGRSVVLLVPSTQKNTGVESLK